jgi:S1-C subfamily serine protease
MTGIDINLALVESLDLSEDMRGVIVAEVITGGPVAEAGLQTATLSDQTGDISGNFAVGTHIDGVAIHRMGDMIAYLARETTPGDTVTFTVLRNGEETVNVPVTLSARSR